jgi:mannose-6-phosphate isomerase
MVIERASVQVARKPWGVADLLPWSRISVSGERIGELWFQRADRNASVPKLLLKLLFTSAPLSIQVHPDDAFARTRGLPNGKTEAWYVLSATPAAKVAVGLKVHLTPQQLRASIRDGSIADLVQWRPVAKGDVVFVPGGTIHAIGAGIVVAEIQQHSDATFRLFDFGRQRELHEDDAVAASDAGPAQIQPGPRRLTTERTLLVSSPYFVLERIDLRANASFSLNTDRETWFLALEGHAAIGLAAASVGDAIFIGGTDHEPRNAGTSMVAGANGLSGLIAYPGPDPIAFLLRDLAEHSITSTTFPLQPSVEIEVRS